MADGEDSGFVASHFHPAPGWKSGALEPLAGESDLRLYFPEETISSGFNFERSNLMVGRHDFRKVPFISAVARLQNCF